MTIDEAHAHVGDGVVYRPHHGGPAEDGEIVRVGTLWVYVLYRGDRTPKATSPEMLALVVPDA